MLNLSRTLGECLDLLVDVVVVLISAIWISSFLLLVFELLELGTEALLDLVLLMLPAVEIYLVLPLSTSLRSD